MWGDGIAVALIGGVSDDSMLTSPSHWFTRLHIWARRCAVVAAVLAAIALLIDIQRHPATPQPPIDISEAVAFVPVFDFVDTPAGRPHYRYSGISGGVYSREGTGALVRRESDVAAHSRSGKR